MRLLRIALPLALIALCLWLGDARGVAARLAGVSLAWLGLAAALLAGVTALSALRWRMTAAALGLNMPAGSALRDCFMAQFVNLTLPGGVLGDVARAQRSRRGAGLKIAAQAVVIERASGQVGMGALLALGLALSPRVLPGLAWGLAAAPGALAAGLVLWGLRGRGSWARAIRAALLGRLAAQAALSLSIAALTILAFAAAARATGSALPAADALLIVPLILTAMLLPASIGGWGWREGAASALFPLAGLASGAGLAASIAFGLAALIAALPGAFFVLRPGVAAPENRLRLFHKPKEPT
ncbi:lysylphosphatidylglycerol synthase transmembrane domain-containing protein [Salipiger sp. 1_MG-2023]|uniref:lysylphosphatidylglycerol synthase transmembrane domain-containing protein n=1 Tax=Salipiger sp. 1_MG-2023 TaxID=3062665 RepID=UPI0026E1EB33|nr:lysylphosphatidylglycerol synthase transmembrane domain-containing protein [Salipiger sp. 1_MG-2023]MDO6584020.1 lysylphosphatidylglycerol synthase transmembrane domain-containing protein [Salipiger sp. 1_MG-2023]